MLEYPYLMKCEKFDLFKEVFSKEKLERIEESIKAYEEKTLEINYEDGEISHKEGKEFFKEAVLWYIDLKDTGKFIKQYGDNPDYKLYKSVQGSFRGNNLKDIQRYVNDGADVNHAFMPKEYGYVPLHWAAHNGDITVMKFLKDSGADINALSVGGKTPLDVAIERHNQKEIVDYLISNGAKRGKELGRDSSLYEKMHMAAEKIGKKEISLGKKKDWGRD